MLRRGFRPFAALGVLAIPVLLVAMPAAAQQTLTFVDAVDPGSEPCGIATAQVGRNTYLLAGSHGDDTLSSYRVLDDGTLEPGGTASLASGSGPAAVGFAYGRYAIVANQTSSDVSVFRLDSKGELSAVGKPVATQGRDPADMVVTPTGLVAVTNNGSDDMSTFWMDKHGKLRFLQKVDTGAQPAGVTLVGNRVAVANTGSANVSVFRLSGKKSKQTMELDNTTAIAGSPLDLVSGPGDDLYVATAPAQQGAQSKLFQLRLQGDTGALTEVRVIDAGLFLSGLTADVSNVYAATVNDSTRNEVRVYDADLNLVASTSLASPPNSMTLAASGSGPRTTDIYANEFGNSTTSVFRFDR